ncbi:uncharacterized protein CTRU02_200885 [Colletotrichum truncatum]|uniref:Uncharacterized protein n=1 Tax=Colletotrichum truncatum TaxID=5467 RepID=A0ACC3ZG13_COLTU|nr:uncharacterized protein CTRU02_00653 [Colletotrichum truncatum]KAF6801904.1 hypothetical protein CTRU02_00653 [Colletotrichum truncatum]
MKQRRGTPKTRHSDTRGTQETGRRRSSNRPWPWGLPRTIPMLLGDTKASLCGETERTWEKPQRRNTVCVPYF